MARVEGAILDLNTELLSHIASCGANKFLSFLDGDDEAFDACGWSRSS